MKIHGPRDLPDLRLELLDRWRPGGPLDEAQQIMNRLMAQRNGLGDDFTAVEGGFDCRALKQATLWWVTEDMGQLVAAAAPSLPPTTLVSDLMPATCGLAVFEKPLIGMSAQADEPDVQVDALLWGDSETLKTRIRRREYVGISVYRTLDMGDGTVEWAPLGRTDWAYGDNTEEPVDERLKDEDVRLESMAEDRRWMACLWLLASQERVGEQSVVSLPRPVQRRSQRAGYPADVRLIDVRRRTPAAAEGEGHEVEWSHRWLVRPHWRQQAYGPERSLRRPILVPPHVKGPADKPLVVKPAVNVVRQ